MSNNIKKINDTRFSKVFSDPKFKPMPKKVRKVEMNDSRFKSMFTDKRFNDLNHDEYGRFKSNIGF